MSTPRQRTVSTPRARARAQARGVTIETVVGTGPRGRINARDVERHREPQGRAGGNNPTHLVTRLLSQSAPVPVMSLRVEADVTGAVDTGVHATDVVAWTRRSLMAVALAAERWSVTNAEPDSLGVLVSTQEGLLALQLGSVSEVARELRPEDLREVLRSAAAMRVALPRLAGTDFLVHHVGGLGVDIASQGLLESVGYLLTQGCVEQRPTVVDGELAVRWMTTLVATFDVRRFDVERARNVLISTRDSLATP